MLQHIMFKHIFASKLSILTMLEHYRATKKLKKWKIPKLQKKVPM